MKITQNSQILVSLDSDHISNLKEVLNLFYCEFDKNDERYLGILTYDGFWNHQNTYHYYGNIIITGQMWWINWNAEFTYFISLNLN